MIALYLILALAGAALFLFEVWTRYLAIMALYRLEREGKLGRVAQRFGTPLLMYGYLVDFLGNLLVSILFLDLPREPLITSRLQRYADGPDGWRRRLGLWFAENLLDPFDPKGYHVRQPVSSDPAPAEVAQVS